MADTRPLHEEADVEFVRHADAAMHLYGLLNGERGARAGARFGDGNDPRCLLEIGIEDLQGFQYGRPGDLYFRESLCRPVLQSLEGSDRLAELLALL